MTTLTSETLQPPTTKSQPNILVTFKNHNLNKTSSFIAHPQIKACMSQEDDSPTKNLLKRLTKRPEDSTAEEELDEQPMEIEVNSEPADLAETSEESTLLTRQAPPKRRGLVRRSTREQEDERMSRMLDGMARREIERLERIVRRKENLGVSHKVRDLSRIVETNKKEKA